MRSKQAPVALVVPRGESVSADNAEGLITKERIADALLEITELYAD